MAVVVAVGSMVAVAVVFVGAVEVDFGGAVAVDTAVVAVDFVAVVTAAGSDMEEALDTGTVDLGMASDSVSAWGIGADGGIRITDIHITATLIPRTIILTPIRHTIPLRL
jgi:hypothetical protein